MWYRIQNVENLGDAVSAITQCMVADGMKKDILSRDYRSCMLDFEVEGEFSKTSLEYLMKAGWTLKPIPIPGHPL